MFGSSLPAHPRNKCPVLPVLIPVDPWKSRSFYIVMMSSLKTRVDPCEKPRKVNGSSRIQLQNHIFNKIETVLFTLLHSLLSNYSVLEKQKHLQLTILVIQKYPKMLPPTVKNRWKTWIHQATRHWFPAPGHVPRRSRWPCPGRDPPASWPQNERDLWIQSTCYMI